MEHNKRYDRILEKIRSRIQKKEHFAGEKIKGTWHKEAKKYLEEIEFPSEEWSPFFSYAGKLGNIAKKDGPKFTRLYDQVVPPKSKKTKRVNKFENQPSLI